MEKEKQEITSEAPAAAARFLAQRSHLCGWKGRAPSDTCPNCGGALPLETDRERGFLA